MATHVHEMHPAIVHAPLVLVPTAALVDLGAARAPDGERARVGAALWTAAVASGVLAAVTGLATSQEVKADDKHASDTMFVHGVANAAALTATIAVAAWRARRGPALGPSVLGLAVAGAMLYTGYLGGSMVYGHGLGVRSMPADRDTGVADSPPLLSRAALGAVVRDVARGLGWLVRRAARALSGREPIDRAALYA